jgi:FkbM family methyltransferase
MTENGLFVSPKAQIVRNMIWGQPVYFTVTNPKDIIQRHHLAGEFYEQEELEIIRKYCPPGAVFCDIGANIGNHSLFALKFLHIAKTILFEPNPVAIEILLSNLSLNGEMDRVVTDHLGFGLSDTPAEGLSMSVDARHNLGGGKMVAADAGALKVIPGDQALAGETVNFIKLDVEGMEIQALAGLAKTIARCRPTIFVEVDRANRAAFQDWVTANRYLVAARFRRYRVNENFLLQPLAPPVTDTVTAG